MPTGSDLVAAAMRYSGTPYVLGAEGDLDPGYEGVRALDCSELVQVALADLGISFPDGTWNQVREVVPISVEAGLATPGALLFTTGLPDHVAISRGDSTTIEARGRAWGTGSWSAVGRFVSAGLIPALTYTAPGPTPAPIQEDPVMLIHHPEPRSDVTGNPAQYQGRDVLDFAYLPNDGQTFGPLTCACHLVLRRIPGGETNALVFVSGAVMPVALPEDGRTVTFPVPTPGLVSVVGDGIDAHARELWVRLG